MADPKLNIIITLTDQLATQIKGTVDSLEKFEKVAKDVGRSLSQVGQSIALLGGSISGPFILALANADKSSQAVHAQFLRLNSVTNEFQRTIAESVVPVFEQFNNVLNGALQAFNNLEPAVRNQITQGLLLAGIFLSVGGVLTIVIGKTIQLASNVAGLAANFLKFALVNPVLVAVGAAIAVIVVLMFKFKGVADVVLSTFEVLFRFLQNGFLAIKANWELVTASMLEGVAMILEAMAKIPGNDAFTTMAIKIRSAASEARILADRDLFGIVKNTQKIGEVLGSGEGEWSRTFQTMKESASGFFNTVLQGNSSIAEDTTRLNQEIMRQEEELRFIKQQVGDESFMRRTAQMQEEISLEKFKQQEMITALQGVAAFTLAIGQTIQTNLSGALTNMITGAKSAKEAFADLGRAMIQTIVSFMAQKVVAMVLSKTMLAGEVAASKAAGLAVAASWAKAAALVSLATLGSNAIPASAAIIGTTALATTIAAIPMAEGGSGIVNGPTLFLAGERGPERFNFEPISGGSRGNGGSMGNTQINIYLSGADLGSTDSRAEVAEDMGFKIEQALRTTRSI